MKFEQFTQHHRTQNNTYILSGVLFACGLVIGGAATALMLNKPKTTDGKQVLENVKNIFADEGPIEGSWIELQPVDANRFGQEQSIYYGGISRTEKGQLKQYEFIADAENGKIIDLYNI